MDLSHIAIKISKGRKHLEEFDDDRNPFIRDKHRIIHSKAFRRLDQKTQVFMAGSGDHYRTRPTHTLEVAQISRDIARRLQLNEDLCEVIALAHDLKLDPWIIVGPAAFSSSLAFILVTEGPTTVIPYASGYFSIRDMAKAGIWMTLAAAVCVSVSVLTVGTLTGSY